MKRIFCLIFAALLLAGCGPKAPEAAEVFVPETRETAAVTVPEPTAAPTETTEETLPPEEFLLTFAGDCTLGSAPGVYYARLGFVKTVGKDYGYPFRNVLQYFVEDDFSLVNLEGVLANYGSAVPKAFNFRGPEAFVSILTGASVEAVSLANNHTEDYGKKGYDNTCRVLKEAGVTYVERNNTALHTTERGLTIGIYGMVYEDMDLEAMKAGIASLKEQGAQLILVAAHWGVEMEYEPTQRQEEFGHAAIDAGAHIVVGTHPHVLQPVEEYNGGVICYSLGNFTFGGNGDPADYDTAILQQQVLLHSDGAVTLGYRSVIPASISSETHYNNYQPTPYHPESPEYARVLEKLQGTYEKS